MNDAQQSTSTDASPRDAGTPDAPPQGLRGDSVAVSVLLLVGLTVVQRSIGLLRNVWFCRVLEDDQLGRWSLTFNFLLLAAPLIVLGLPGSFGRYAERYRRRGQFRSFLLRTTIVCGLAAVLGLLVVRSRPEWFALLVFGDIGRVPLVPLMGSVLAIVIVFNFLIELLMSLRLVRFVSAMQLSCSLVFALVGVGLLTMTSLREEAVMLAYAAGALTAIGVGATVAVWFWRTLPVMERPLGHRDLWTVLLPFAGWIWAGNLVANLFEVADQFMLKYFSGLPASAADSLVGQYYSSRVIPLLMVSVAGLLAASVLPHLTRDWEAGRRQLASRRLNTFVKLGAITFTIGAGIFSVASPLLFTWALGGKYDAGRAVLPGTLTYCIWYAIGCVATNYLLCAEKARLASAALLGGLLTNVALNYFLAPRFGLSGVVIATMIANAVALGAIFFLSSLAGMRWQPAAWIVSLMPLSVCLGGIPALAIVAVVLGTGWWEGWLMTGEERGQLEEMWHRVFGPKAVQAVT